MRTLFRQVRYTNKTFWRNPASAFFTFAFPLLFLVIFTTLLGNSDVRLSADSAETIKSSTYYVFGMAAFGMISACYTNIAISVVFAREEGVLKRLRGTPLPPGTYLTARVVHASLVRFLLVAITVAFGVVAYGAHVPTGSDLALFILTLVVVPKARDLARYRYTAMLVGIVLLALPILPGFGREINGSRIWVGLGPLSFQPGEFAKIGLAIFFAGYLVDKRELLAMSTRRVGPVMLPEPKHLGPVLIAWGVSLLVMAYETDLGSSLLFFSLFIVML